MNLMNHIDLQSQFSQTTFDCPEKNKVMVGQKSKPKKTKRPPLGHRCVSFSGGRTSAMMAKLELDKCEKGLFPRHKLLFIFANTGLEHEKTLKFVHECDIRWGLNLHWVELSARNECRRVDFKSASRNGEPFEVVIREYGISNTLFPHCSREMKKYTINRYLTAIGINAQDREVLIGYRADEIDRISVSAKKDRVEYPLIDAGITEEDVLNFWLKQDFGLNLPTELGNCRACWKKSDRKLITVARKEPDAFDFFLRMEKLYGGFIIPSQQEGRSLENNTFFRGRKTASWYLEQAANPDFKEFKDKPFQVTIDFDDLDAPGGCGGESCEGF
jgi:3'-phosphoadenosine 5'-phosphosulfate sulfotransferase (PAPS reductase)/FAD synthetase